MNFLYGAGMVLCALGSASRASDVSASAGFGAEPPRYVRYYFKQPMELPLRTDRLAVLVRSADRAAGALAAAGLEASTSASVSVAGWTIVDLKSVRDADEVERAVASLIQRGAFDFVSPVFVGNDGGPVIITPDLLVGFDRSTPRGPDESVLAAADVGEVLDRDWNEMERVYRLRASSRNGFEVLAAANRLAQRPDVAFAEPDVVFSGRSLLIPNDPGFGQCWGLHNTGQNGGLADQDMDAPEAWDLTTGSNSIIVAVIDTGVQSNHPDLNLFLPGIDTTSDGGDGNPFNGCDNHGTPVAGCISARINNGLGTVGIAPSCRSGSARTFISSLNCSGGWNSQSSWTVNSLTWAQGVGARVTNNSNYYGFTSGAITQKYIDTRSAGIVHFASAGNDASSTITYPASIPAVNSVAALSSQGQRAGFSNYGVGLDFSAPGEGIYTTDRTAGDGWDSGNYVFANGTSFASPYAAGVAALILSQNPALSAAQVEERMQATCVNLGPAGYDTDFGWGFVNARAALQAGVPMCRCDWDGNQTLNSQDFFSFLTSFFVANADFNQNGVTNSQDFFEFLACFFAGC